MVASGRRSRFVKLRIIVAMMSLFVVTALVTQAAKSGARNPEAVPLPELARVFVGAAHEASRVLPLHLSHPLFILVLGSDARPGEVVSRARSDAIHIIGINTKTRRATILDFPRDSWVHIPGHGMGKINSAMVLGGPALTVRTLEALTGIPIDYYVLTSFGGFRRMVDWIGGVVIDVPYLIHDPTAGPGANHIPEGRHRLTGTKALALSRSRHNVPGGDFGRTMNQGRLLQAGLAQLQQEFPKDPSVLFRWISAGYRNFSSDLPPKELLSLAIGALSVPSTRVNNVVVPGSTGFVGASSVVFLSSKAGALYADMRKDGLIG